MDDVFSFPALDGERVQSAMPREQLIAAAHAEADAITEAARARGHEEGLASGLAEAQLQLAPVHASLAEAVAGLERAADEVVPALEQRAVELAIALAEKILATSLQVDPSLVASVAAGALRRVTSLERIVLEVHPDDVDLMRTALDADEGKIASSHRVEVAGERRVGRGGCVVRTTEGAIDARVEQQLERAAVLLRETVALAA